MIHVIDEQLRDEARRYRLRFACPDCHAFDPVTERCAFGFPTAPHKSDELTERSEVIFCKAFELL